MFVGQIPLNMMDWIGMIPSVRVREHLPMLGSSQGGMVWVLEMNR